MPLKSVSKKGYVLNYALYLKKKPALKNSKIYFSVVISDEANVAKDTVEFKLIRNISSSIDEAAAGDTWAVTYSAVQMAMIATIKDALLHCKKVFVKGIEYSLGSGRGGGGEKYNSVESIKIMNG